MGERPIPMEEDQPRLPRATPSATDVRMIPPCMEAIAQESRRTRGPSSKGRARDGRPRMGEPMGAPEICHGRFAPKGEIEQSIALLGRLAKIRPDTHRFSVTREGRADHLGRTESTPVFMRVESQEFEIVLYHEGVANHRLRIPWTIPGSRIPSDRTLAAHAVAGHARSALRMLRTCLDMPVGLDPDKDADLVRRASIVGAIAGLDPETAGLRMPSPWSRPCVVRKRPGLHVEGETSLGLLAVRLAQTIIPRGFIVSRDDRDSFLPNRIVLAPHDVGIEPADPMEAMRVALRHGCRIPMGETRPPSVTEPVPMGDDTIPMGEDGRP
jgi:hypothetical protein